MAASIISNYWQILLVIFVDYNIEFWHVNGIAVPRCLSCVRKLQEINIKYVKYKIVEDLQILERWTKTFCMLTHKVYGSRFPLQSQIDR